MNTKLRELIINEGINEELEDNMIVIKCAKHDNLKNITLKLSKNKLIVLTGVSGGDESTLVFDIIHAEAQRWVVKSLTAFVKKAWKKLRNQRENIFQA